MAARRQHPMATEDCYSTIQDVITALEEVRKRTKTSNARAEIGNLIFKLSREYKVEPKKDMYKLHNYV
jgi:hypothetical protein